MPQPFVCMTPSEARDFAQSWLPAWTGNNPEKLVSFYTEDVIYLDPAVPKGIEGRDALLAYFSKLLAKNPYWVWTQRDSTPLADGFLNKWRAEIPVGERALTIDGVCSVQLRDGKIYRNEVYFDRSAWIKAAIQ